VRIISEKEKRQKEKGQVKSRRWWSVEVGEWKLERGKK